MNILSLKYDNNQMKSKVITITPVMADYWLTKNNVDNRNLRHGWINYLTDEIKSGNWHVTHQGIAFDVNNRLLDGQHRLYAVVNSGISVDMLVTTGLPTDTFKAMDNGMKRNMSDLTNIPKGIADPLRLIVSILSTDRNVHPEQMIRLSKETDAGKILQELIDYCGTAKAFYSMAPVKVAAYMAIKRGNKKEYVFEIYSNLIHQKFDKLPPIAHCLIRQVNDKKISAVISKQEIIAKCAKVFDIRNANIRKLFLSEEELRAVIKDLRGIFLK